MADETILPQYLNDAILEHAGANRIFESHKHDLWRGDEPWHEQLAAVGKLVLAIKSYGDERAATAESKLPRWRIAATEKPPQGVDVLCRHVSVDGEEDWYNVEAHGSITDQSLTHWMPLPEEPK